MAQIRGSWRGGLAADGAGAAAKHCVDVIVATALLAALAPLMALIALCIVVESPGPVLYRARRVGRRGRTLHVLKFRKMRPSASSVGRPLTVDDDDRFTRIGQWLARTKLDELPQLLNVVGGGMSLIGPRPEDPVFVLSHASEFEPIIQVRPGLTGLSQIAFASEAKILDRHDPIRHYEGQILPQKLRLDQLYLSRWRPLLDLQILYWTVVTVIFKVPIAVSRSTAEMNVRRRPRVSEALVPRPELLQAAVSTALSGGFALTGDSALVHPYAGIGLQIGADGADRGEQAVGEAQSGSPPQQAPGFARIGD